MKMISAREAKNAFGQLIESALVEPIVVAKHGRPIVVVMRFDDFERLTQEAPIEDQKPTQNA